MINIFGYSIVIDLANLARCATLLALVIAIVQLCLNRRTQKISNSIEILSWFDSDSMIKLLEEIEKENLNSGNISDKTKILDLLYYLDTMFELIKHGGVIIQFFYQMNHDFEQIGKNQRVIASLEKYQERFPVLELTKIIELNKIINRKMSKINKSKHAKARQK